jgi:hypothetical protein
MVEAILQHPVNSWPSFLGRTATTPCPFGWKSIYHLDDEVKVVAIPKRTQVVIEDLKAKGFLEDPFDLAVHSTGAPDVRSDEDVVHFHTNVLEDVHPKQDYPATHCLFIDRTDLVANYCKAAILSTSSFRPSKRVSPNNNHSLLARL